MIGYPRCDKKDVFKVKYLLIFIEYSDIHEVVSFPKDMCYHNSIK